MQTVPPPTAAEIREQGVLPFLDPLPRFEVSQPGNILRVFERGGRFRSNWELSAARSIAMMELLVSYCNIPRERLSIAGYADNAPVAGNESEEGRRRNRRVDIVILNQTGLAAEPATANQPRPPAAAHTPASAH